MREYDPAKERGEIGDRIERVVTLLEQNLDAYAKCLRALKAVNDSIVRLSEAAKQQEPKENE